MGQAQAESGLKSVRESCYYKRLKDLELLFIVRLKARQMLLSQYLKNSEKCANYVYANREGNGNEARGWL
jgi:putative chitinase